MSRLMIVCILCVCFAALCSGCAKQIKTYSVEGTITINGKPAEKVLVTFVPKTDGKGLQASGITDAQGVYKLTSQGGGKQGGGAVAADYAVTISKREAKPLDKPFVEPISGKEFTETFTELMPIQYRNAVHSPLSATVNVGDNKGLDFDIKLK